MQYLLNSAVLTAFGTYAYDPLSTEQARTWLTTCVCDHSSGQLDGETCRTCQGTGYPWQSTIGYEETARALEVLCDLPPGSIPVQRLTIQMQPGDSALVFRLVLPPGSPRIDPQNKGQILGHIEEGHWELGLLWRRTH